MKVLIYENKYDLAPIGGPKGYLYNLNLGLKENNIKEVDFLENKPNEKIENLKNKLKRYPLFKKIIKKLSDKKWIKMVRRDYLFGIEENDGIDFNEYDIIHFHSTGDMYKVRGKLEKCKAKIVLTSHSPKPFSLEILDLLKEKNIKNIDEYYPIKKMDEYAFDRADYIFFPCKEAEEPYYNQWKEYDEIHKRNVDKYRYILTGIKECNAKYSRSEIRKKYGIPQNAFLISYVGRHNQVKGYDLLKEIGRTILEDMNEKTYFIIAGVEGPIYRLKNEKWIEVGWTSEANSIIASSDLFVLPNKETYFDLVLLEVLSLGVPVLASYTGGNKYFETYENSGIFYFNNKEEAVNQIKKLSHTDSKKLEEYGKLNKDIFLKDFNESVFAKNYIELVNKL